MTARTFRARRRSEEEEWMYGGLLTYSDGSVAIHDEGVGRADFTGLTYPCDWETVGQDTGQKDSQEKAIFEGDILRCDSRYEDNPPYAEVVWDDEEGCWGYEKHEQTGHGLEVETGQLAYLLADYNLSTVDGNIYENPDLLQPAA